MCVYIYIYVCNISLYMSKNKTDISTYISTRKNNNSLTLYNATQYSVFIKYAYHNVIRIFIIDTIY